MEEKERNNVLDVLFKPSLVDKKCMGIHELTKLVINSTAESNKRIILWESILLTGGVSCIKGTIILKIGKK